MMNGHASKPIGKRYKDTAKLQGISLVPANGYPTPSKCFTPSVVQPPESEAMRSAVTSPFRMRASSIVSFQKNA